MTKKFPDDPSLTGWMAPFGTKCDAPDLIVEGELPDDLVGTYYRNGPVATACLPVRIPAGFHGSWVGAS
ncbi:MAG: carotenoid oxygenase family protein [Gammaproteobacteria bacterium]|nr:carotenoid oxygenase family protein [Gammaproteobacteria bacterium]